MTDSSLPGSLDIIAKVINLGDQRLNERVVRMVTSCLSSSRSSLASMFGEADKELKASQRLLSNEHVDPLDLRELAYAYTGQRIAVEAATRVVCAYDPTLFDFSMQNWKLDRMPIGDGNGRGYKWLNAMIVDPRSNHWFHVPARTTRTALTTFKVSAASDSKRRCCSAPATSS